MNFLDMLVLLGLLLPMKPLTASTMVVTYGLPSNYTNSLTVSTDSWENCVRYCYELENCVLVYSPVSPLACHTFNTKEILAVQKLDSSQQKIVAFKIDNTDQTCPAGENAPTYDNNTAHVSRSSQNFVIDGAQGTSSSSIGAITHNISFTGNQWVFSYQNELTCATGWTTFSRPLTNWCIKLFGGPDVSYTQVEAAAVCNANNSVLSGLETQEERTFVASAAWDLMGANYPNWTAFWVSGIRKTECTGADWPSISYCSSTVEQFTYSDQYQTNYAGYTWDLNTPDRNASGTWQNCVQIWIRNVDTTPEQPNGATDDALCDVAVFDLYALRGAACGKLPDVSN